MAKLFFRYAAIVGCSFLPKFLYVSSSAALKQQQQLFDNR